MFIMLLAIMVGVIIITFFIADISRQTQITELKVEHEVEIQTITNINENFTDNFLQGSITMDSAREIREEGNYHFDFALFWYNTAIRNTTNSTINRCIGNCTLAMGKYILSYERFNESSPYFENAMTFTDKEKYLEVLGYYVRFAFQGKNITLLRYNASDYLRRAAENLSIGDLENMSLMMEMFNLTEALYEEALEDFEDIQDQIDGYLFFNEIREED
jgi:hypothetical protein